MTSPRARARALRNPGLLAPVGLVITWSSGFVGAELSRRAGADPLTILGWRFVLLSGLLLIACGLTRTSLRSVRSWLRQGTLAVLCQALYLGLVFEGIRHGVAAGTSALVAALQPLLVATVAGRLLGERSTPTMWLGMVLGFGGVAVVVSGDLESGGTPAWAYVLPAVGMLSLAGGTVLARRLRPSETMLQTVTIQAVVAAIAFMAAAAVTGRAAPPVHLKAWLAIGWLIALASLGGYVLYIHVTQTLGATVVSTLLYLTPPVTMLWAFAMFGDPVTGLGFLGLLVSGAGVVLALRGRTARAGSVGRPEPARVSTTSGAG